jgi:hypothetical protein
MKTNIFFVSSLFYPKPLCTWSPDSCLKAVQNVVLKLQRFSNFTVDTVKSDSAESLTEWNLGKITKLLKKLTKLISVIDKRTIVK